jgi:transposase
MPPTGAQFQANAPAFIAQVSRDGGILVWDGNGVWLCQRRLHRGSFIWPKAADTCFTISQEQWQWLIAGVDWQRLSAKPNRDWQV